MGEKSVARDEMTVDLLVIGGGPAGLSAAIAFTDKAAQAGREVSVIVIDKGAEIGAHILSGAVIDPVGLDALLPDWRERGAPLDTKVADETFMIFGSSGALAIPNFLLPPPMRNTGNYVGSLGALTRWLAAEAANRGVEIYPATAASDLLWHDDGALAGVVAGGFGVARDGTQRASSHPGMNILGRYVVIAEGARGSLATRLIAHFGLDAGRQEQKFGLGLKELWRVPDSCFRPGHVMHAIGWPLDAGVGGGGFAYHFGDHLISLGLIVHLDYLDPHLSPYDEFQRFKLHPRIRAMIGQGERIGYGARAIAEGGYQSVPRLVFPGGCLIGCAAGLLDMARLKGSHNAVLSGIMAAEAAFAAIAGGRQGDELTEYQNAYDAGMARSLAMSRNAKPLWSRWGGGFGVALAGFDLWCTSLFGASIFGTLPHLRSDRALGAAGDYTPRSIFRPDRDLTFDKSDNLAFSGTNHEENQPAHLSVIDPERHRISEKGVYDGPSGKYCPAGVFSWHDGPDGRPVYTITAQDCLHCKTCDIKDPNDNIRWTPPEGGGGPVYSNM